MVVRKRKSTSGKVSDPSPSKTKPKIDWSTITEDDDDDVQPTVSLMTPSPKKKVDDLPSHVDNVEINENDEDVEVVEDFVKAKDDPFRRHFWLPEEDMEKEKARDICVVPEFNDVLGYVKRTNAVKNHPKDLEHFKPFLQQKLLTTFEKELLKMTSSYEDVLYCRRTFDNAESLRRVYCMHVLNHAFRTRDQIITNNMKEKKTGLVEDSMRDQSYHRAKVLILLPTRDAALKVVDCMASLLPQGSVVSVRKRFQSEFAPEDEAEAERQKKAASDPDGFKGFKRKAPEYYQYFSGNTDDHFRLGISVAKKTLKLYTSFEESDIILASTLGLKTILDGNDKEETDLYFLSSIEVLVIDQLEMLLMQNWSNLLAVLNQVNQRPSRLGEKCHLLRCRQWCLTGQGTNYRQNWIASSIYNTTIAGLLAYCNNYEGVHLFPPTSSTPTSLGGCLPKSLTLPIAASKASLPPCPIKLDLIEFQVPRGNFNPAESRFKAFERRILPRLKRGLDKRGLLLYFPDYFDLVEVRTLLRKENLDICVIDEYTSDVKADRFRTLFAQGRVRILVYSERYHFFRRRKVRGIRAIIFYGPPNFPHFVAELCDSMQHPSAIGDEEEDVKNRVAKTTQNVEREIEAKSVCQMLYHTESDSWQMAQIFGHLAINKMMNV